MLCLYYGNLSLILIIVKGSENMPLVLKNSASSDFLPLGANAKTILGQSEEIVEPPWRSIIFCDRVGWVELG